MSPSSTHYINPSTTPDEPGTHSPGIEDFLTKNGGSFNEVYEIGKKIGEGTYGTVYETTRRSSNSNPGETLAVKILSRNCCPKVEEKVVREMSILRSLQDVPNVVRLIDFYIEKDEMYSVQDLAQGGDLFDYIINMHSQGIETFTEKNARTFAKSLLTTIDAMHKCGVVHRDLKPENFLLKNKDDISELLLCDFGLARMLPADDAVLYGFAGTIPYMAHELLDNDDMAHGKPVDMWSAGCILFLLLGGHLPFGQDDSMSTIDNIIDCNFDFDNDNWDHVSYAAKDLICNLLEVDPNERWTASKALKSDWFTIIIPEISSVSDKKMQKHSNRRRFNDFLATQCSLEMHVSKEQEEKVWKETNKTKLQEDSETEQESETEDGSEVGFALRSDRCFNRFDSKSKGFPCENQNVKFDSLQSFELAIENKHKPEGGHTVNEETKIDSHSWRHQTSASFESFQSNESSSSREVNLANYPSYQLQKHPKSLNTSKLENPQETSQDFSADERESDKHCNAFSLNHNAATTNATDSTQPWNSDKSETSKVEPNPFRDSFSYFSQLCDDNNSKTIQPPLKKSEGCATRRISGSIIFVEG